MSEAMRSALKGRRMKGLDIHIIVGKPDDQDDKESDLAPNPKEGTPMTEGEEQAFGKDPVEQTDVIGDGDPDSDFVSALGSHPSPHQGAPSALRQKVKAAMHKGMKK